MRRVRKALIAALRKIARSDAVTQTQHPQSVAPRSRSNRCAPSVILCIERGEKGGGRRLREKTSIASNGGKGKLLETT